MTSGNDDFLREKAKQLLARERELLAMRRKHNRLSLWFTVAQKLAAIVDPKLDLVEVCGRVAGCIVATLDLHTVAFFELEGAALRPLSRRGGKASPDLVALDPTALAVLGRGHGAVSRDKSDEGERALSDAIMLDRFLWHRMTETGGLPILLFAGHDRERAQFYDAFDADDLAHFVNTAAQLSLLIRNGHLVRELERDKEALRGFNIELERRVDERTGQLAAANRSLEHALESLHQKDERMVADIEEARIFQQKVLEEAPRSGPIEFGTAYRPLERVGGDVLDVHEMERGCFRIFLADATGHGVQAAMRTILIKTEYDRIKLRHATPHTLLEELNRSLSALFPGGEILSTGCCLDVAFSGDGARITYANAGTPPLWHWSGGLPAQVHMDAPLLGFGQPEWPPSVVFRMTPGDVLVVASDGLTEQYNDRGEAFEEALKRIPIGKDRSAVDCVETLLRDFEAFRGETPVSDDVTLIGIRVPPP